ncbi:glycosyltransferase family 2 protein [Tahibacter amnicola]|uniref:Glycosyltransferase n=1 Tax=Tahibacter amnicola TaxID=2976241 RepID=A0ABY6BD40_9GAMM|nr:glycosyltransferase [Tahibacter amnicola]UXI67956.1 glycosyltransferase [Tahibacter amnicola]
MSDTATADLPHRVEWDGRQLQMHAAPAAAVDVYIDDILYACLQADGAGRIALDLPHSPSGRSAMALHLRAGPVTSRAVGLHIGQPGLSAAPAIREPRSPPDAELIDARTARRELAHDVAIVVPVYNAPEAVRACLDSVLEHTVGPARLIVIDDASPDPAIAPLLEAYRHRAGVTILRNATNLGFTATANRGITEAGRADVVLLNADAEVAAHWLCGLRRACYTRSDTASATAVSDNAGAFSVPELECENPFPEGWQFVDAARALWQSAGTAYPELPTGNGFCLYLRRSALDAVGLLDAEAFPQGYGEENDWCQRAEAAGWRHVIAGNVLVRHARSQSFGHERRRLLGEAGMRVLRERWPHYEAAVGMTLFSPARRALDWRVRRRYAEPARARPRVLWLDVDPVDIDGWESWRWTSADDGAQLDLRHDGTWRRLETGGGAGDAVAFAAGLRERADYLGRVLQCYAIDTIVLPDQSRAPYPDFLLIARNLAIPALIGSGDDWFQRLERVRSVLRAFADPPA